MESAPKITSKPAAVSTCPNGDGANNAAQPSNCGTTPKPRWSARDRGVSDGDAIANPQ